MGIMTRMLRLCKADVHGVMDQLEDRGLLLRQYLREMEASLENKERQIHDMTRNAEQLQRQALRHGEEMEKLETDLNLALEKEKDDIARMLIRRRRALETACRCIKDRHEAITREKTALSATLADQRLQYETLEAKAQACCRQDDQRPWVEKNGFDTEQWGPIEPREEEVELELLQRKEALRKGGPA
jgi:phage shock protein A